MKRTLSLTLVGIICIFLTSHSSYGQVIKLDSTSNWKKAFKVGVNLNQASFSSNWKAGGVNSIGFNSLLNFKANYKKDNHSWDNEIDMLFGMVNNEGQGNRKTLDRIFLDTKVGHSISKNWDLSGSLNFQSQFAPGYRYDKDANGVEQSTLISDFLAPAFITAALGVEYHPVPYFKVRISPLAPRITIVNDVDRFVTVDNPVPYGVKPGDNMRLEWLAFQLLAEFNKDIAENINLKWRYVMFANYETFDAKTIDHRFDLNLVAKVNKFVNVSIGGIVLYDYDQDKGVQLSQTLNLGILYAIQNFDDKK